MSITLLSPEAVTPALCHSTLACGAMRREGNAAKKERERPTVISCFRRSADSPHLIPHRIARHSPLVWPEQSLFHPSSPGVPDSASSWDQHRDFPSDLSSLPSMAMWAVVLSSSAFLKPVSSCSDFQHAVPVFCSPTTPNTQEDDTGCHSPIPAAHNPPKATVLSKQTSVASCLMLAEAGGPSHRDSATSFLDWIAWPSTAAPVTTHAVCCAPVVVEE